MATKESTAVAVKESALPAMPAAEELREVFETNFEGITPSFETIKMPTGGGLFWSVPAEEGETPEKELTGIVLDHYGVRTYWEGAYSGGKVPPTCFSTNLRTGSLPRNDKGEFGECSTCAWSKFATKIKPNGKMGRGQACGVKHRIFLLMPDRSIIFPYLLTLSVTSSTKKYEGSFSTYTVKLGSKLKKITKVVTRVKLIPGGEDEDGNKYSLATFYRDRDLSPEEQSGIDVLRSMLQGAMRNKPIELDEAEESLNGNGASSAENADPWEK